MPENAKKPQIRFKGFTDAWEQRKVSNLFKVARGYVLPATFTSNKKTIETPYPVYSSQTKENGLMGFYKDYLYNDAITWTTDGANAGTVQYRTGKFYCTNVCGVLLSNKVKANQMIAEALNNVAKNYVSYVGNPKLMNNVMADIEIILSKNQNERESISKLFYTLDNLITLHQRKLDKLKNIKKSMLEKMFPKNGSNVPEIRFTGFTDAWEQRKLGNLVIDTIDNRGKNPPYYCESGIPIIDNFMIKNSGYPDLSTATRYIDDFLFENFIRKYNEIDDTLITLVGNGIGQIALFPKGKSAIIQNTLGLRFSEDKIFMYYILLSKHSEIVKLDRGMAQPSIRQDELKDVNLNIPKRKEQFLLGKYFRNLDNLITLHQRKLEKLQNIKKACLEKMFV